MAWLQKEDSKVHGVRYNPMNYRYNRGASWGSPGSWFSYGGGYGRGGSGQPCQTATRMLGDPQE